MKKIIKVMSIMVISLFIIITAGCSQSSPYIGENGNWYIGGEDTGVSAQGPKGDDGENGSDGTDGAVWLSGATYPEAESGRNGDMYIDTSWGYIYRKSGGTWELLGNIKGEAGEQGQKGDKGDKGTSGEHGETGLSAYEIYKKYNPYYSGSEEEWISDLASGRLKTIKVSFDSKGGSAVTPLMWITPNITVEAPEEPGKLGYIFESWYKDEQTTELWDWENDIVTEDLTLYAKWVVNENFVQAEPVDLIELHTWFNTSGVMNNAIVPLHSDRYVVFEMVVDSGCFILKKPYDGVPPIKSVYVHSASVESGETVYWTPHQLNEHGRYSMTQPDATHAFVDITVKRGDKNIGYAVIEIIQKDVVNYEAKVLVSAQFPKVNGAYQNITEKEIESVIKEIKNG